MARHLICTAAQWELQRATPPTDVVTSNSSKVQGYKRERGKMDPNDKAQQLYTTANTGCTVRRRRAWQCSGLEAAALGPRVHT